MQNEGKCVTIRISVLYSLVYHSSVYTTDLLTAHSSKFKLVIGHVFTLILL